MSIRTKLVAVLTLILTVAMGTTGGVLIARQARHDRALVAVKQELLVEHAAFALQENLSVAARELTRLSKLPEIDPADNDLDPERELLYASHENSVIFKELRVLDPNGRVSLVQPVGAEAPGKSYADRTWFADARKADQPFFYTVPEHGARAEGIAVIVPLRAQGKFVGAIQGILDLGNDRFLTPELRHAAGDDGEFAVIDRDGRVIFPTEGSVGRQDLAAPGSPWANVFEEVVQRRAGTMHLSQDGAEQLYAFAPVGLGTWGVAMRWPSRALYADVQRQVKMAALLLGFGIVLAGLLGVLFAAYLSRPITELGEVAGRLARGEPGGAKRSGRSDEIGALNNAFAQMEEELSARDQKIREDMETISRWSATLEERVASRTRELEIAQARLLDVERFAAMGKTSAAIAHELRNALNGLGMCVDLVLADTPASAGTRRVRGQISRELSRLRNITDSLLVFSRTPRLDAAPCDLNALVQQALDVLADDVAESGVAVTTELDGGGAPLSVTCDGYKVQGVVINLVKNAIEAMATRPLDVAGSGEPAAPPTERRVRVATLRGKGAVTIEVADNGPGVSAEARTHLFEPFFTTKVTGTGLGLTTARRLIEAHGGTIEAVECAAGACFRVTIPEGAAAGQSTAA
jgi:signal transduction histidine kinase